MSDKFPIAAKAAEIPPRVKPSNYPEPFFSRMGRREKRQLGDFFGLAHFGVNLTTLQPGGESSLLHGHSVQEEFIYVLEGKPTLRTGDVETELSPGDCAGFRPGGPPHQLVNRTDGVVIYLEIGDRLPGDEGSYPEDDLQAVMRDGRWVFAHKDGTPY